MSPQPEGRAAKARPWAGGPEIAVASVAAKPASHTRAESRGSRPAKADAGERRTVCWREMDSNFQFPVAKPRSTSRHGGPSWLLGYGSGSVGDRRFESISLQQRVGRNRRTPLPTSWRARKGLPSWIREAEKSPHQDARS